ncbi:MAG: hypothetical protein KDK41_16865 [Leptospiraceae bacterium]|nr:hypothetical protein [Leptospiraceae bacterium]MCB1202317.1 hypothetical protein [Leptospiraceae bacterium]
MTVKILRLLTTAILFTALFAGSVYAEKNKGDYINDLTSGNEADVIAAAKFLADEKPEDAVDPMINAIKAQKSSRSKIAIISALGAFDQKGRPASGLKEIIETEKDNTVVYSALLAVMNLKDIENADTLKAIEYCESNKQDDPFVRDITGRMRKLIQG